uniref:Uncharacterized protein n=3 Tax=Brassica TaxID=3705 RepID=M4EKV6_BRACM
MFCQTASGEEAWFESNAAFETDCDNDFHSVNEGVGVYQSGVLRPHHQHKTLVQTQTLVSVFQAAIFCVPSVLVLDVREEGF